MEIKIRRYEDKDIDSLNIVLEESYGTKRKGKVSPNYIELVALNHDTVVGYLVIQKAYDNIIDKNFAYIYYVCVLKEYRGNGIASKLLDRAIELAKEENISYIELTSNKTRKEAQGLYKKMGFRIRKTNVFRKELV